MDVLQGDGNKQRRYLSPRSRKIYALIFVPLLGLLIMSAGVAVYFSPWRHTTPALASSTIKLPGHVPQLIRKSQLVGQTDPNTPIMLLIGLQLRNQGSLQAYVDQLQQTHTSGHMTPDQIAKAYAPLPSSQRAAITYLQQYGFTIAATYKHHLLLNVKGTIGEAESAFNVQINNYRSPSGRFFYAPASDPSVPDALGGIIQNINGLDTTTTAQFGHPPITPHTQTSQSNALSSSAAFSCASTSNTNSYYLPYQIAHAYNLDGLYNLGFYGEGQSVALFELSDFQSSDIAAYTTCFGGSAVPIQRFEVNGGSGSLSDTAVEAELDIELVLSAAPHLAQLAVYEAPNSSAGVLAEWSQIVSDAIPVVSTSWGACEPLVTQAFAQQEDVLFAVAAAQGQSVFAASGDFGSNDCASMSSSIQTEAVDDPASQPYVTGVGGTTLQIADGKGTYGSEQAWSINKSRGGNGSGGGVSTFWTMPTWQQATINPQAGSNTTACASNTGNTGQYCREVPDVAFDADPSTGYIIYYSVTAINRSSAPYTWLQIGGTSAAAPMWAAMTALANQKLLKDGYFNLGFLNPLLYQDALSNGYASYNNDFHDITTGTNATYTPNLYTAAPHYDMVTGWGSFDALALVTSLEKQVTSQTNPRMSAANTTWYFSEGSVGNSFQEYITLLNPNTVKAAIVNITYLFENNPSMTIQHVVSPSSRFTVSVNADVGVAQSDPQVALSAIVQSDTPIVAERPMYFDFHGIASGTDVVGATNSWQNTFYFAEGDTRQDDVRSYYTYVTMLNPSTTQAANVTVTYISNGSIVGTQAVVIPPMHRGTATPTTLGLYQQVAIKVTSDIGIVVERPLYFKDNVPTAGGWTTGAASTVGATSLGIGGRSDYLFAEGYTGTRNDFQENLIIANFASQEVTADVTLEYTNGSTQTIPVLVPALSQYAFDVNNAYNNPLAGCNCTPTPSVSAEVTASTASIVVERLMYFHFGGAHLSGGTDIMGEPGPSKFQSYAFAEGYTYGSFSEFLTLQNPNNSPETVAITLYADNTILQIMKLLPAHSRTTVSINSLIVPMATAYPANPPAQGFEVSLDVQCISSGSVVAERPMYFDLHGDIGGTDVLGYTGG